MSQKIRCGPGLVMLGGIYKEQLDSVRVRVLNDVGENTEQSNYLVPMITHRSRVVDQEDLNPFLAYEPIKRALGSVQLRVHT